MWRYISTLLPQSLFLFEESPNNNEQEEETIQASNVNSNNSEKIKPDVNINEVTEEQHEVYNTKNELDSTVQFVVQKLVNEIMIESVNNCCQQKIIQEKYRQEEELEEKQFMLNSRQVIKQNSKNLIQNQIFTTENEDLTQSLPQLDNSSEDSRERSNSF